MSQSQTQTQNIVVKKTRAKKVEEVVVKKVEEVVAKKEKKSKKEAVVEEELEEEQPVLDTKKKRASKKAVVEEEVTELASVDEEESVKAEKRVVDRESVMSDFDSLIQTIEALVDSIRSGDKSAVGVQSLRSLNSKLKTLQKHTSKIAKGKKVKKAVSTNSGFNKPIPVSREMKEFAGWDKSEEVLHSRNDVTKFICGYVKDKNLQYPENRQQIVLDTKLKKLLNTDGVDMLTYSGIQKYIKHHYPASKKA
jgi:chromatin remodeling complex protein RSC6